MEILKKTELPSRSGNGKGAMGMYEEYLLKKGNLEPLLNMGKDDIALITTEEMGSNGNTSGGCVYGLNKVFVAGRLPLKAKSKGKDKVVVIHTGKYDESQYATEQTIKTRVSDTPYEQPSPAQIERVHGWLVDNGYLSDGEETVQSEKFERVESDTPVFV